MPAVVAGSRRVVSWCPLSLPPHVCAFTALRALHNGARSARERSGMTSVGPTPPLPAAAMGRQGNTHYHHPKRASSAIVSALHTQRAGALPVRAGTAKPVRMRTASQRAPAPPTVPKERQAHVEILRKARQMREDRLCAAMAEENPWKTSIQNATLETNITDYVEEDGTHGGAWDDVLGDIEADVVVPARGGSHQFSGRYEADLVEQIDGLRQHRKRHPQAAHPYRVAHCLDVLEAMAREVTGPVSQFLSLCAEELKPAIYLPMSAQDKDRGYLQRMFIDEHTALVNHEKELQRLNAELQKALSAKTDEHRQMVADFASDDSLLAQAKAEIEELKAENAKQLVTIQRQKDNTEFLDDQIDELQANLEKLTKRKYPMNAAQLGPFSSAFVGVVEDSDKEMSRILGYKAADFEEMMSGRGRRYSQDPMQVLRRMSRSIGSEDGSSSTRRRSSVSPFGRKSRGSIAPTPQTARERRQNPLADSPKQGGKVVSILD